MTRGDQESSSPSLKKPTIRLMPEAECWPLWDDEGNNLEPAALGLSDELARRIVALAESYDAKISWDDPADTTWPEPDFEVFQMEFWSVAEHLQEELGPDVRIEPRPPWPF